MCSVTDQLIQYKSPFNYQQIATESSYNILQVQTGYSTGVLTFCHFLFSFSFSATVLLQVHEKNIFERIGHKPKDQPFPHFTT